MPDVPYFADAHVRRHERRNALHTPQGLMELARHAGERPAPGTLPTGPPLAEIGEIVKRVGNSVVGDGGTVLATRAGRRWAQRHGREPVLRLAGRPHHRLGRRPGRNHLVTRDAGLSWQRQPSGSGKDLLEVHMRPDTRTGWALGDRATILGTRDGGVTWETQDSGGTDDLIDIHAVDPVR
ncbi:WD40/YVTN/BNR-like repeat-containing protein [Streptomyces violaceus]|uniref:Photosynthesis system II assembly factor Ycf48/Hcf136-like domain-containing protein n=1 Tax=Streptomyces violaceus TaxID=1936 RepID=A0ABY9U3I6_STRVL|nr:hypothetical protein [Streptomyces janthinus]WND17364.1 hypothetical protein RI060_08425 [Streptomyces janthinus]